MFVLQRTGNPEAQLTLQEIQAGIDQANEQAEEAMQCEQYTKYYVPSLKQYVMANTQKH